MEEVLLEEVLFEEVHEEEDGGDFAIDAFGFADGGVVSVADGAVALNFSDGSIVGVAKGLGFEGGRHEQQEGEEEGNDVFHRSGWAAMIWLHTEQKTRAAAEPLLAEKGRVPYLGPRLVVTRMAPLAPREP